jgi:hypothetical protein
MKNKYINQLAVVSNEYQLTNAFHYCDHHFRFSRLCAFINQNTSNGEFQNYLLNSKFITEIRAFEGEGEPHEYR